MTFEILGILLLRIKKQGSIFFLALCLKIYLCLRQIGDWYEITFTLERATRNKVRQGCKNSHLIIAAGCSIKINACL